MQILDYKSTYTVKSYLQSELPAYKTFWGPPKKFLPFTKHVMELFNLFSPSIPLRYNGIKFNQDVRGKETQL